MRIQEYINRLSILGANKSCPICSNEKGKGMVICDNCRKKIENYSLKNPLFLGDFRLYQVTWYEGEFRKSLIRFKYRHETYLAKTIAYEMASAFLLSSNKKEALPDLITYIPSTRIRIGQRGFNPVELLAKYISLNLSIPMCPLLVRNNTKKQTELTRKERLINMKGSFLMTKAGRDIDGLKILLIDDVITTGATLKEASKVLRINGATDIWCLVYLSSRNISTERRG